MVLSVQDPPVKYCELKIIRCFILDIAHDYTERSFSLFSFAHIFCVICRTRPIPHGNKHFVVGASVLK